MTIRKPKNSQKVKTKSTPKKKPARRVLKNADIKVSVSSGLVDSGFKFASVYFCFMLFEILVTDIKLEKFTMFM